MMKIYGPEIPISKVNETKGDITMAKQPQPMDMEEAGRRIDRLVRDYIYAHPEVPYDRALQIILDRNPALKRAYVETVHKTGFSADNSARNVRDEVDHQTKIYMRVHPECDYEEALSIVLDADPGLKEEYAKS